MKWILLTFIAILFSACVGNDLSVKGEAELSTVSSINRSINRYPAISDKKNYGVEDYFASPSEFYKNGGGDCEDYAIAKREKLIENGINETNIKFLLVKFDDEFHMILSVFIDNKEYYLDNREQLVFNDFYLKNKMKYTKIDYYSWGHISSYISKDKSPK